MTETKKQPELVLVGPQHIAIVGPTGTRVEITGPIAARIALWHDHMGAHGPKWAATYLAGVIDGMSAALAIKMQQALDEARARLAEGAKEIAAADARREIAEEKARQAKYDA
jgi:hypothetical protein